MKPWTLYGLVNSLLGLIIGIYIAVTATGDGHFVFAIAAPIAAFLTGASVWRLMINEKSENVKVFLTGLLTGTISHYVTFILISIGMNICYWTTGNCTGSLGDPPASILSMLTGAFAYCFFSLMLFGWITVSYAVLAGFILKRRMNKIRPPFPVS